MCGRGLCARHPVPHVAVWWTAQPETGREAAVAAEACSSNAGPSWPGSETNYCQQLCPLACSRPLYGIFYIYYIYMICELARPLGCSVLKPGRGVWGSAASVRPAVTDRLSVWGVLIAALSLHRMFRFRKTFSSVFGNIPALKLSLRDKTCLWGDNRPRPSTQSSRTPPPWAQQSF